MRDKKARVKTISAFGIVLLLVVTGLLLDHFDQTTDVFPNENTVISLYGEAHGFKRYYDIEFEAWSKYYDEGYRNLFVELPYYSAEFLNEWMKADSDELIDLFFEEIQGTQSGNESYYEFFHEIKERCPETIFSRSFFADSSYMLSFSVLCSCVCSRLISPSVSSWHKQDNTLMHQSPGHIQRRTPYNF